MEESNVSTFNSNESSKDILTENKDVHFKIRDRIQKAKETFLEWSSRTDMNNYKKIFEY